MLDEKNVGGRGYVTNLGCQNPLDGCLMLDESLLRSQLEEAVTNVLHADLSEGTDGDLAAREIVSRAFGSKSEWIEPEELAEYLSRMIANPPIRTELWAPLLSLLFQIDPHLTADGGQSPLSQLIGSSARLWLQGMEDSMYGPLDDLVREVREMDWISARPDIEVTETLKRLRIQLRRLAADLFRAGNLYECLNALLLLATYSTIEDRIDRKLELVVRSCVENLDRCEPAAVDKTIERLKAFSARTVIKTAHAFTTTAALHVSPRVQDMIRGDKVLQGAKTAHIGVHGTLAEKRSLWKRYQNRVYEIKKMKPIHSHWAICKIVAKEFGVSPKTIQRRTTLDSHPPLSKYR